MAFNYISMVSALKGVGLVLHRDDHLGVPMDRFQHFLNVISYTCLQRLVTPLGVFRKRPDV